ncbi:threonine aldolase family protein [Pararhizobium sp. DWP3-4]|uniref:threonine aldolase family protein n=1 Tax=Pararhizobium sp. DWP3-4 TaxID=2804565 RepID=UPI003CED77A6
MQSSQSNETNASLAEVQIDLRSDTVTRPTAEMYASMRSAPLGDDGLEGDPTVQRLEATTANILGKEAGLFFPTCTMANLVAAISQAGRNEQVLIEANAHMFTSERGSATFSGLFYEPIAGEDGAMDIDLLTDAVVYNRNKLKTALICMETSHNNAGGTVLPLEHMRTVFELGQGQGVRVHLDGARLFNAAVALDVEPSEISKHADSVSVCLSKGLSAPAGAILVASGETIKSAKALRKMLGGTQRQVGILAAAGLEGILNMGARLIHDHTNARRLSEALNDGRTGLKASRPQTNIVQVDVSGSGRTSFQWRSELETAGLWVRPWGVNLLRCVTHRHISEADIDLAVDIFKKLA